MLFVSERDVYALLPMHDCIDLMHHTFAELAHNGSVQPLRIIAWQPDMRGAIATMPAWLGKPPALGAKLISVFPQNRRAGIESHQGFVILFSVENGEPQAIVNASAITAIRTAAVSGVATRLLARQESRTLALLGSGTQAHMHLDAMLAVRPIENVRIWSRTPAHAAAFAAQHAARCGNTITTHERPEDAVAGADIICTVTAATQPVLQGKWLRGGEHINAVGSSVPPFRELDSDVVVRAKLYVDSRESALREPEDIMSPIRDGLITAAHILGDLAELAGGAAPARVASNDITLFKSVGLAIEDLAAATLIYERALAAGRGTPLTP